MWHFAVLCLGCVLDVYCRGCAIDKPFGVLDAVLEPSEHPLGVTRCTKWFATKGMGMRRVGSHTISKHM